MKEANILLVETKLMLYLCFNAGTNLQLAENHQDCAGRRNIQTNSTTIIHFASQMVKNQEQEARSALGRNLKQERKDAKRVEK